MNVDKQYVVGMLGQLAPDQFEAVARLLEVMLDPVARQLARAPMDDEGISEEEEQAVARSKEWFKRHQGTSLEQVVEDLGLTMAQIRNHRVDDEASPTI